MYTSLKNYQVIISLLKQNNIRHLVLSAGTRNIPFVQSVENDSFLYVILLLMSEVLHIWL